MHKIKLKYMTFAFIVIFVVYAFFNAGNFLDITSKPVISDVIACLDGTMQSVNKTISLYQERYASSDKILIINGKDTHIGIIKKSIPKNKLIYSPKLMNTAEEIRYIKEYMVNNHYKSVMIVSEPPHSRRIQILTSLIRVKGDEGITYNLVNNDAPWWHPIEYYNNHPTSLRFIVTEVVKIPYTYIFYGVLELINIRWDAESYKNAKNMFNQFIERLIKGFGFE